MRSWRFQVGFWCVLAAVLRLGAYFAFPGRIHFDETFQYIEQANRLLGGHGLIPWEYIQGVRSWLIPALVAVPLGLGHLLSGDPLFAIALVSVCFGLLSVVSVFVAFRWGLLHSGPAAAISSASLMAFCVYAVYVGPHALADTLAMPLLVVPLYLADPARGRASARTLLIAGVMFGLCAGLRVQLGPAVAVAILLIGLRDMRGTFLPLFIGSLAGFAAVGLLDWITWGSPFQSIWLYAKLNALDGVASKFGTMPWYTYLLRSYQAWGPALLPMILLGIIAMRRAPILLAVLAAAVLPLFLISHKEARFIYPAIPLAMTLIGIGAAEVAGWMAARLGWTSLRDVRLGLLLAAVWAVANIGAAVKLGPDWWGFGVSTFRGHAVVNRDPAACGMAVWTAGSWYWTGGYSAMRSDIPMYGVQPEKGPAQFGAFNYIFSMRADGQFAAQGYQKAYCGKQPYVCIWKRPGVCKANVGFPPIVLPTPG